MTRNPPPPVIDAARVLAYAFVDDLEYRRYGALIVGGKLLEQVPRLAICVNLGQDMGPLLFHCDGEWNVLGVSGADTVEGVRQRAERNYPGVNSRWVDVNTSQDDALRYYDAECSKIRCSFCGKRPYEMRGMIEGHSAVICRDCIDEFYRQLQSDEQNAG